MAHACIGLDQKVLCSPEVSRSHNKCSCSTKYSVWAVQVLREALHACGLCTWEIGHMHVWLTFLCLILCIWYYYVLCACVLHNSVVYYSVYYYKVVICISHGNHICPMLVSYHWKSFDMHSQPHDNRFHTQLQAYSTTCLLKMQIIIVLYLV
jgi:cellulose synthase/poly-beta-1,6-N-acetylglucosamine synthase-like glycosyltransferase